MHNIPENELSHEIHLSLSNNLSPKIQINIDATSKERGALAKRVNVKSIEYLKAKIFITNSKVGFFDIMGVINSDIVLVDSVSGKAEQFSISDKFEEKFILQETCKEANGYLLENQIEIEIIKNNILDLGEIVAQNFSLALEPLFTDLESFNDGNIVFSAGPDNEDNGFEAFKVLRVLKEKMER